jgi:phage gpG-like protein
VVRDTWALGPGEGHGAGGLLVTMFPSASALVGQLNWHAGQVRSLREPLERAVREVVIPRVGSNFAGTTAAGNGWQPIQEASKFSSYRKGKEGNPTLDVSGKLKRHAQTIGIWTFTQQSAFVAGLPTAPYGIFHQDGAVHLVPREFLIINDQDINAIEEIFKDWVGNIFGRTVIGGRTVGEVAAGG